jgi:hypothetical protein
MDSVERMPRIFYFYVFTQDIEKPWDYEDNQDGFLKKPARKPVGTSIASLFVSRPETTVGTVGILNDQC